MRLFIFLLVLLPFVFTGCKKPEDKSDRIEEIYSDIENVQDSEVAGDDSQDVEFVDESDDVETSDSEEELDVDNEVPEYDVMPHCGDGIINGPEVCDDGAGLNGTEGYCNSDCTGSTTGALCTGQTKCYNDTEEIACPIEGEDFYGQDAQYINYCKPMNYTIEGSEPEEIVVSHYTGLEWQRVISLDIYTWQEAVSYCETLDYGGYDDWRLPEMKNLISLNDFGTADPSLYSGFTNKVSQSSYSFWAEDYPFLEEKAWSVGFQFGVAGVGYKTSPSRILCVRGDSTSTQNDFSETEISGDYIVTDDQFSLQWTKDYYASITEYKITWGIALEYCEDLTYGRHDDWRLPNINELITLLDTSERQPASKFPGLPESLALWSSTTVDNVNSQAFGIAVSSGGLVTKWNKTESHPVLCVRNNDPE